MAPKFTHAFCFGQYKLEPRIKELTRQNEELKDELNYTKRLLREVREKSDINQLEASRSEIRSLNDRLVTAQATNAQLTSQVTSLLSTIVNLAVSDSSSLFLLTSRLND